MRARTWIRRPQERPGKRTSEGHGLGDENCR